MRNIEAQLLKEPEVKVRFEKVLNTEIAEKMMKPSFKKNRKAHLNMLQKEKAARLAG